jgi:hypothetical protein
VAVTFSSPHELALIVCCLCDVPRASQRFETIIRRTSNVPRRGNPIRHSNGTYRDRHHPAPHTRRASYEYEAPGSVQPAAARAASPILVGRMVSCETITEQSRALIGLDCMRRFCCARTAISLSGPRALRQTGWLPGCVARSTRMMRAVRHEAIGGLLVRRSPMTRASTVVPETRGRLDEVSCSVRSHTWISDERAREDHAILIDDGLPGKRLGDSFLLAAPLRQFDEMRGGVIRSIPGRGDCPRPWQRRRGEHDAAAQAFAAGSSKRCLARGRSCGNLASPWHSCAVGFDHIRYGTMPEWCDVV